MDAANLRLADYLARAGADVRLVAHRVAPQLLARPGVVWQRVAKPLNSYRLGAPLLARAGARADAAGRAAGGRTIANGGNCATTDTNWVHYVHAAHRPEIAAGAARRRLEAWTHRRAVGAERNALRRARFVIANSERTRRDVIERVGVDAARVRRVYYGADPSIHRPPDAAERAAARAALAWRDERPACVFVGALGDRRKGFDTLFAAWERLCRDAAWDARLVVVGAGQELAAWRARVEGAGLADRIRFTGFISDVRAVLWAADAVVAPTRYEAYGLGVHEAVCCGLPAIVSEDAGVAERLGELDALRIRKPDDADDLAAALWRWRRGTDAWRDRAAPAAARLRAWTWDDMARQIVAEMAERP
ncbi:MAG: glycosyltransferase family 4 protein [Gemmatimonadota bacterium]|nr:glycosyltransferase family 4 protein [Gemmatimonadota bacterium]